MESVAQPQRDRYFSVGVALLAAVVLLVLCAVLVARLTGFEPAQPVLESPLEVRTLGFRDGDGGRVEIHDWETGEPIAQFAAGEGSFLRGVVRSLVRQRRGSAIPEGAPFELSRYRGDRLVISDPATGEHIDLIAFGPDNVAVFDRLMAGLEPATPGTYRID